MTDNRVILREDGLESVVVNRSDGLAVGIIKEMGIRQMILSKEKNKVVEARARKLDIPVFQGIDNKKDALLRYCLSENINLQSVAYIGNDLNDLEAMTVVGFPACPSDACEEIKKISRVVFKAAGGAGVVREFLDYLIHAKNA